MLAATVPVAAAVEVIEPVTTFAVVYLELDDAPSAGATVTSSTAPIPTTISAIAANLTFIGQMPHMDDLMSFRAAL